MQERLFRLADGSALHDGGIRGVVLLGKSRGQLREADGLLAEVIVQLRQELLGQVLRIILCAVDAPVVLHKLLPRHFLLDLHALIFILAMRALCCAARQHNC